MTEGLPASSLAVLMVDDQLKPSRYNGHAAIKPSNAPKNEYERSSCGEVRCSTLRQELGNGTGERCRISPRPIMANILKHNQLSPRDALADRFTD